MVLWFYNLLRPQYGRSPLKDRVTNFLLLGLRRVLIALDSRFIWTDDVKGKPIRLTFDDDFSRDFDPGKGSQRRWHPLPGCV
jgi:hypothetical protein